MRKLNINGMSVSEKLDAFRFTEQDPDKACHIAQAADEARDLERQVAELQVELRIAWNDGQIGNPPPDA